MQQAITAIVPALAPPAIAVAAKLIERYITDDRNNSSIPQIIQIPIPSGNGPNCCGCCCRQLDNNVDCSTEECSTCKTELASTRELDGTKLTVTSIPRSSSTSDLSRRNSHSKNSDGTKLTVNSASRSLGDLSSSNDTLLRLANYLEKEGVKTKSSRKTEKSLERKEPYKLLHGKLTRASADEGHKISLPLSTEAMNSSKIKAATIKVPSKYTTPSKVLTKSLSPSKDSANHQNEPRSRKIAATTDNPVKNWSLTATNNKYTKIRVPNTPTRKALTPNSKKTNPGCGYMCRR